MSELITGKELAQKVLDHVEAHPEQHDNSIWVNTGQTTVEQGSLCGTTACLAGWAVLLNRKKNEAPHRTLQRLARELGVPADWQTVAAKLLLGDEYADSFYQDNELDRQFDLYAVFYTGIEDEAIEKFAEFFAEFFGLDTPEA